LRVRARCAAFLRDPQLLKEARYERAKLHLAAGKTTQGRKELEKLYAEDAAFRDVTELLQRLSE
jgi:hypothetical protein